MKWTLTLAILLAAALPARAQTYSREKDRIRLLEKENALLKKQITRIQEELSLLKKKPPIRELDTVDPPPVPGAIVTAVADDVGLVVISIGKEDGVKAGQEVTIHRGSNFVAKVVINRIDRKWSAGKVVLKTANPRVGDSVRRRMIAPAVEDPAPLPDPERAPSLPKKSEDELKSIRKELDDLRAEIRALTDKLTSSWKNYGVALENASKDLLGYLKLKTALVVRRVEKGSPADKAGLRVGDVLPNQTEAEVLRAVQDGGRIRKLKPGGSGR